MIKLAYIEYDWKISLAAKRKFKERTGLDLMNTLWGFVTAHRSTTGMDDLEVMHVLSGVCGEFDAADVFYCLFNEANSCVTLDEISDGMERTSGLSVEDGLSQPWPLVLVKLAYDVEEYYRNINKAKKKADLSDELDPQAK